MNRFLMFIFLMFSLEAVYATEDTASIRFVLERENSSSQIVYYFTKPNMTSYPILILCDGSESKGDVGSVLYIRGWFSSRIEPLNVGFLTVEKWGIDGSNVNEEEFWNHYTRSQRLEDHLKVIHHFEKNPPDGWNGKFIFMGVSEGGPLVTDLSTICSNTLATINWVGAGDWSWADEFWQFFESKKQNSTWITPSDIPQTKQEYDAFVQYIIHHPTPNERMGGMTYLYHADAFRRPSIDYRKIRSPFLVVIGTEDSNLASSDQFVQKAQEAGAPLTYFRVSGMDHYIRKRPDVVDQSFSWLQEQLLQTNS